MRRGLFKTTDRHAHSAHVDISAEVLYYLQIHSLLLWRSYGAQSSVRKCKRPKKAIKNRDKRHSWHCGGKWWRRGEAVRGAQSRSIGHMSEKRERYTRWEMGFKNRTTQRKSIKRQTEDTVCTVLYVQDRRLLLKSFGLKQQDHSSLIYKDTHSSYDGHHFFSTVGTQAVFMLAHFPITQSNDCTNKPT